jgi:hypothetical protein
MPEFEIRLLDAQGEVLESLVTDAINERAASAKAASLAKKMGAPFFDLREPLAQRWIPKS